MVKGCSSEGHTWVNDVYNGTAWHSRFDQVLSAAVKAVFVGHRRHHRAVGRDRRTDLRTVVVLVLVDIIVSRPGHRRRVRRLCVSAEQNFTASSPRQSGVSLRTIGNGRKLADADGPLPRCRAHGRVLTLADAVRYEAHSRRKIRPPRVYALLLLLLYHLPGGVQHRVVERGHRRYTHVLRSVAVQAIARTRAVTEQQHQ